MQRQRGFTYLGVLVAIALIGIGLAAAGQMWAATARRQRIEQLDWAGQQFVQAIGSYYESTPGRVKTYPHSLQELLQDNRYVTMRRHLRAVYVNPMTGVADWKMVMTPDGGIRGVAALVNPASGSGTSEEREYVYGAPGLKPSAPRAPQ
jgi:type II secretory pathway pseudopilin PulG